MAVNSICWPLPSKFSFFSFKYKRKIQVQPLLLEFRRLLPSCLVAMDGVCNEDLLHAAVGLYDTYLPDITPQVLYSTVCGKWAKTLLLVRTMEDFLQEQESEEIEIIDDRVFLTENDPKRDDFGFTTDIDTDISGMVNNSVSKPSVTFVDEHQYDTSSQAEPRKSSRRKRNKLAGSVSDSDNDSNYSENSQDEGSEKQLVPTHSKESAEAASKSDEDDSKNDENRKFDGVFSDTDDSEESSEEEDEEEDFSKGVDSFIEAAKQRRRQRQTGGSCVRASTIGIENLLVGAATYERSYSKPGEKVIQINLVAVRKRFRKSGVGKFIVDTLKDPTMLGPYDALAVYADSEAVEFFRRCGFTDDVVLNSRFSDLTDHWINSTLMCYLPPFTGSDISGVYRGAMEMKALEDDIKKWRDKSLEAYQAQASCVVRMQHEITTLRAMVETQEETIRRLTEDKESLEHVKYQLEKELLDNRVNSYGRLVDGNGESDDDLDLYESLAQMLSKKHVSESEVEAVAQGDFRAVTPETEQLVSTILANQSEKQLSQQIRKSLLSLPRVRHVEVYNNRKVEPSCIMSMETGFDSRTRKLGDPSMCTQLYFCGGSTDEQIDRIMRWGFSKDDFTSGEYGRGLYFSIHPSQAAQFSATGKLLIANVGLGLTESIVLQDKTRIFPPAGYDSMLTPGRPSSAKMGGRSSSEKQEYVIFDQLQAVPVYLVEYSTTRC